VIVFIQDITQKNIRSLRNSRSSGICGTSSRSRASTSAVFLHNDAKNCPSTAPPAAGSTAWPRRRRRDRLRIDQQHQTSPVRFCSSTSLPRAGGGPPALRRRSRSREFLRGAFPRKSVVNISGMSFGAISEPAVRALSRGCGRTPAAGGHGRGRALRLSISRAAATSSCRSAPPTTAFATPGETSPRSA